MREKCGNDVLRIALVCLALILLVAPAMAATTQVHVVKYANDNTTILNETTKTYQWMESNLPVYGDGITHYYFQGPTFDPANLWDPGETINVDSRDYGAAKGSDVKDLCDLVGGMNSGEWVKIKAQAPDLFSKNFDYEDVYTPEPEQGKLIIAWYNPTFGGYPPVYDTGMRLIFFADPEPGQTKHVFGNWDMHEYLAEDRWSYYYQDGIFYPSSSQLSVQNVGEIIIYSDDAPPAIAPLAAFSANVTSGVTPLAVQFKDESTGTAPLSYKWDFNGDGEIDSTLQNPEIIFSDIGTYPVNLTVTNDAGSNSLEKANFIIVYAAPVAPTAAFTSDVQSGIAPLTVKFTDASTGTGPLTYAWDFNNDGSVDNTTQNPTYTYTTAGTYTVNLTVTNSVTSDSEVKAGYISVTSAPVVDTLYNGPVTLMSGETFNVQSYVNATGIYPVDRTTPLGALDTASQTGGLTVNITDFSYSTKGLLMVDDINQYRLNKVKDAGGATIESWKWQCRINRSNVWTILDDWGTPTVYAWNNYQLQDGDQLQFYFGDTKLPGYGPDMAIANVLIAVDVQEPGPVVDTIYDGTVTLTPGETFNAQAYNNATGIYTVNRTTPLGALDTVATLQGFTYNITDSRWSYDQVLLLDDIGQYRYKKPNVWNAYVNGVYKDGYGNHANGLNVIEVSNNDQVNFYYAPNKDPNPVVNATAVVKIKVNIGDQPTVPDWTLSLSGAKTTSVTKTYFENGLACPASGHQVNWTDTDGNIWGGVPLWVLVSMVDDNPDVGPDHFNFNDSIAAQGYSVKVSSGDGWDTTLASQAIARNDSYIVANTLNGLPLPTNLTSGKLSWPLHLKGAAVFGGQQVGNITKIELTGLPQPPTEWTLTLEGEVTDTITQSYFVDAIACKHNVTWTDPVSGTVWQGVPLWDLAGAVDDIESSNHYTYNDTRAAMGYTIRVSAADGFNATFASANTTHNDGFFVAYKKNGAALTGSDAPLKLVGPATTSGTQRVGGIVKISLEGLPDQYPAGNWQLNLNGKISDVIPQGEFEYWASCHDASYTDVDGNVYTGVPLWRLMGWVDDRIPHGSNGFDDAAATAGYKVIVKAGDGYAKEFTSQQIGKTNAFIIANTYNGVPIPNDGDHPPYPLRLVGSGATGGNSVGNVVEIQLTDFLTPVEVPKLRIIKYAGDGTTIINETYVDYTFMESNLPVIGDGITAYKFEGLTLNPSNLWDPEETYPGGYKISNVVKGTPVHDLAELVGGMGSGTTITFVASDGFETTLPYSSIYTNPAVQARQGDAIIAWWGDGQYVPMYEDGMRLFFTPDGDHVYGQWDMHETLPSQYWRYNFQDNIQYPSAAGLSAKFITTMKVYSSPESDWTLELDGRDIGGVNYSVSKPYLEEAIACQFGADHKATYTDSKGRVWEGMPLWFFVGFVDDADQHSPNAYNMTKALAGYNIVITGTDDYSTTISSKDIIRSSNYLIANSLNGTHIDDSDESWPLRLTGTNVTGSMTVKGVKSVKLIRIAELPVANFTATPVSGTVPLPIQFTDSSTGSPISWSWDFNNDGITDNTTQSPTYTYSAVGNYTVNLTVTNAAGSDSELKSEYITVNPALVDEWSISLKGRTNEQLTRVNFEALAEGNRLTYNDGSSTWSGIALWRILARVDDTDPATFNDSAADLGYNVTVSATGLSTTISSATLKRNDNWIVADTLNGTPLPKLDGTKNVWPLKIVGTGPTSGKQRVSNISEIILSDFVTPPTAPVAGYTAVPLSGFAPLEVKFSDASTGTGPLTYAWDFNNDGITDNTTQSPSYTYATAGTYTVNLTVTGPGGSDYELKTNYITVNSVPVIDEWSITLTGVGSEQLTRINFEDLAESNRLTYADASGTWSGVALWRILARVDDADPSTFSDSAADLGYNVTVSATGLSTTISSATLKRNDNWIVADTLNGAPLPKLDGTKNVWPLKIVGTGPTSGKQRVSNISEIILSDFVAPPTPPVAGYTAVPNFLSVQFTDQSTGTGPLTYSWDFGDGSSSSDPSPLHTYAAAGTYSVKLTVTNTVGTDDETKTITVNAATVASMKVKKSASESSLPTSGDVTYTYLVENTGSGSISAVTLTDDKLGIITGPALGDTNNNAVLDVGETWTYTKTATLSMTTTNTATAVGSEPTGSPVSSQSNAVIVHVGDPVPTPEFPTLAFPIMVISAMAFMAYVYRRE